MFGQDWEHGTAKVIDRKMIPTGSAHSTNTAKYGYVVDVEAPTGEAFRTEVQDPRIRGEGYVNARVGDELAVLVDFKRQKAKLDRDDPARHRDPQAPARAAKAEFEAELAAAPGTTSEAAPGSGPGSDGPRITINGKTFEGPMDKTELQKRLGEAGKSPRQD